LPGENKTKLETRRSLTKTQSGEWSGAFSTSTGCGKRYEILVHFHTITKQKDLYFSI
jgi:hypothetical protein